MSKLLVDADTACAAYHDENVRGVKAKRVQVDEILSLTYAKQKNVALDKAAPEGAGDTWTALEISFGPWRARLVSHLEQLKRIVAFVSLPYMLEDSLVPN